MRSFPRARRSRLVVAALTASLALSGAVPLAQADDDLKDRQRRVEKRIDSAHDELDHSSAAARRAVSRLRARRDELRAARAALADARVRLDAARVRDAQMQAALQAAEDRLERAEEEVAGGRDDASEQRRQVEDMVLGMYSEGDPDLLALEAMMNAETAEDLARQEIARNAVVHDQTRTWDELRATLVLLRVKRNGVAEARAEVAVRRREAAEHLDAMHVLEGEAVLARDAYSSAVAAGEAAKARADRARARDRAVLERLRAQERRINARIRARALAALRRARARDAASARRTAPGGTLGWPVSGYVTSPFGWRTHPIYGYWGLHDGTDFGTGGCGAPLRASEDGRVSNRYFSSSYGNRLYIDHGVERGVGLTSVYNHASGYTVSVGQYVRRGQVVGYIGDTGWSTACHLHFTVLANGRAVNPMSWF